MWINNYPLFLNEKLRKKNSVNVEKSKIFLK